MCNLVILNLGRMMCMRRLNIMVVQRTQDSQPRPLHRILKKPVTPIQRSFLLEKETMRKSAVATCKSLKTTDRSRKQGESLEALKSFNPRAPNHLEVEVEVEVQLQDN